MLNFITLPLEALQSAAEFYQQYFPQFNVIYSSAKKTQPEMLLLDNSKTKIALIKPEAYASLTGINIKGQALFSLELENIDQVEAQFEQLIAAGCSINRRPKHLPWGGFAGFVSDPFGLNWELHCKV